MVNDFASKQLLLYFVFAFFNTWAYANATTENTRYQCMRYMAFVILLQ